MKVKEKSTEDLLVEKMEKMEDIKATISEFEDRMSEVINDKNLTDSSKVIMLRSAYQRTIGVINV